LAYVKTNWLNAANVGQTTDPEEVSGSSKYGLQVSTSGNFTGLSINLQGSIDGANWSSLTTVTTTGASLVWIVDKPVRYLRIAATISGDGSQSVDASIIAV
jgi:hypothetical protein